MSHSRWLDAEILIVGGGLGGVAAALAASKLGSRVLLTEDSEWLGGQLTSQSVPPDEHPWIEAEGCSRSYRQLRNGIRSYYRRNYPLTEGAKASPLLNPGGGTVSPLCHEPRVAVAVIDELLAPYRGGLQLQVLLRHKPIAAQSDGDKVTEVSFLDRESGDEVVVTPRYIIDATELGDLLELADVEHVTGAESRADTGELHAVDGPGQPMDQQALTWCFAVDCVPDGDHTIDRPEDYEFWRSYAPEFWPGPLLSWDDVRPDTLEPRHLELCPGESTIREGTVNLWRYRRILSRDNFQPGHFHSDITLVNWSQNDYWLGPIVGVPAEQVEKNLESARQLSLSFLYWMQTEAPRDDGATGYPGLRLRGDVLGTADGLAMRPYIRESRRICAEFTVTEQHVGVQARAEAGLGPGAEIFDDTVGVGSYRIDLHPSTGRRTYIDIATYPFQIPLGALIPVRVDNLLPANKNIGTTHITNGCYRLHPVEWNVGEVAGALSAYCISTGETPRKVRGDVTLLQDFQDILDTRLGVQLHWSQRIRSTPRHIPTKPR